MDLVLLVLVLVVAPPLVRRRRHRLRAGDFAEPDGLVERLATVFEVVYVRGLRVVRGLARHGGTSAELPIRVEHFVLLV